ncbi:DsbA family protein [Aureimonas sp. AU22]|uniref:DsbA family protein n=1 Tax=Aureimonas sp. AU22 TaxID=1638162 RepID=UPI0009E9487C|nr:DsbA family protein [Aureimonas sp. AU22]
MTRTVRGARRRAHRSLVPALGIVLLALAGCSDEDAPPVVAAGDVPSAAAATSVARTAAAPAAEGEVDVAALMSGQVLPDVVIGREDAPITIVEYASMTCDHCAAFHANTYPTLKRDYLDTGKAKLIVREFPFDPRAVAASMLARCTPGENGRTAMVDALFAQSESWAHADDAASRLLSIARMAGFTEESFRACLSNADLQAKVVATKDRGANEFGVDSTPTFFIDGRKYRGALPLEQMAAILDAAAE